MEIVRVTNHNVDEYEGLLKALMPDRYEESRLEGLECFALNDNDEICGILAIDITDELPVIECIYVMPYLRFLGYGERLLSAAELTLVTNDAPGLVALYSRDKESGYNSYGFDGILLDVFFESRGYFVTKLEDSDEMEDDSIEMMYAMKAF